MTFADLDAFSLALFPLDSTVTVDGANYRVRRCINPRVFLSGGHLYPFAVIYLEVNILLLALSALQ